MGCNVPCSVPNPARNIRTIRTAAVVSSGEYQRVVRRARTCSVDMTPFTFQGSGASNEPRTRHYLVSARDLPSEAPEWPLVALGYRLIQLPRFREVIHFSPRAIQHGAIGITCRGIIVAARTSKEKKMVRFKRAALVAAVAVLLSGVGATSASALGNTTWVTGCAGYAGRSWYSSSSGTGYASTTASDNDEVGAAIRYYGGSTSYTKANGYALRSRAAVLTGGYHQSYCFPGTQTKST